MGRLLLFLAFVLAPLVASAHGGHHPTRPEPAALLPAAPGAQSNGAIHDAAAPSRCPGGEESCCCHDARCTPSYQPAGVDAPGFERRALLTRESISQGAVDAPRTLAPSGHSSRGPPAHT